MPLLTSELREGDELKFGFSTRSYILLNENSVDLPDIEDENAVQSPVQSDLKCLVQSEVPHSE